MTFYVFLVINYNQLYYFERKSQYRVLFIQESFIL
jgi:hypothetical protein